MLIDIIRHARPPSAPRCFLDRCDGSGIEEVSGYPWGEHDHVFVSPRPALRIGRLTHLCYTRRERRHLARHGRRWPIRVPAYRQHVSLVTHPTATVAHKLVGNVDGVRSTLLLYLPVGQSVTDANLRDVASKVSGEWLRSGDVRP